MSLSCIASIDQGTSSTRVLIISSNGRVLGSHQLEHTQYYPIAGPVEHDPLEIWNSVKTCLCRALEGLKTKVKIVAVGITNQRETTVVWNKENGAPYHKAIVWNDTRTSEICENLVKKFGSKEHFREKTGLPNASYFSASKLIYLLDNIPNLRQDASEGKVLFGTIDTWLIWKLTNGKVHKTDVTNGSRTLLMNINTLQWDVDILKDLDIPIDMLPQITPSSHLFGYVETSISEKFVDHYHDDPSVHADFSFYQGVPISGVLGDQNAALFGQACFHKGDMKCTYGTGAFLLLNTGENPILSKNGLLTTIAYQIGGAATSYDNSPSSPKPEPPCYALEGSVAYSGSVIQWLRDNLKMIESAKETESLARSVPDNGGNRWGH